MSPDTKIALILFALAISLLLAAGLKQVLLGLGANPELAAGIAKMAMGAEGVAIAVVVWLTDRPAKG